MDYNDTIRVASAAAGDPQGMGEARTLDEFFNYGGGVVPGLSTLTRKTEPGFHLTKLTLASFVVAVTSVTTGAGVGGSKIFTFPLGYIQRYSCRAALSLAVETQADFTDSTPEGDVGIGSVAPADADALGTDATDDDWGTAVAFAMTSYVDSSVVVAPEAAGVVDGTSAQLSLYLNALVDAADIDDGTTTNLLFSGDIWILWANQGGV